MPVVTNNLETIMTFSEGFKTCSKGEHFHASEMDKAKGRQMPNEFTNRNITLNPGANDISLLDYKLLSCSELFTSLLAAGKMSVLVDKKGAAVVKQVKEVSMLELAPDQAILLAKSVTDPNQLQRFLSSEKGSDNVRSAVVKAIEDQIAEVAATDAKLKK